MDAEIIEIIGIQRLEKYYFYAYIFKLKILEEQKVVLFLHHNILPKGPPRLQKTRAKSQAKPLKLRATQLNLGNRELLFRLLYDNVDQHRLHNIPFPLKPLPPINQYRYFFLKIYI